MNDGLTPIQLIVQFAEIYAMSAMETPVSPVKELTVDSVSYISSTEAVNGLLNLVKAQEPILDATYGSGNFWNDSPRRIVGCDLNPERAKDVCCSFLALPFRDKSMPTVIYDPPFHPFVNSHEEKQYSGLGKNEKELKTLFQAGLRECWRVTSRHLVVKCQGYVHNHHPLWMPLWVIEVCGEPFEWLLVARDHKIISGRWKNTNSLRRNHADYMVFDKKGNKR